MSFSIRYLPAILLAVLSVSTSLFAQSTTKQAAKVPRGSLSGRVTMKEKGVAGVAIGVRKGELGVSTEPFMRVVTDQDGFYRVGNLAAGNYSLIASAPAFVMANMSDNRYKTVLVGDDENVENINFTLVRGGVITGRVTDADGRPVIDQQVQIFQAQAFDSRPRGARTIYPMGVAQTDDRGIYRVFGLSAGRYKVAAGRNDDESVSYNQPRNISYRQVFHPDVGDQSKATVIEVSEGGESANVDITLGRVLQMFSASGIALDKERGLPGANLWVGVQRVIGQRYEYVNTQAMSNSRGEFVVEGLVPGKYVAFLNPNRGTELRAEPLSFEITDHDVSGLTLKLGQAASVSGVIVLESEDKSAFEKLLQLQLRGYSMMQSGVTFGSTTSSPIGVDGSFRMIGLAGGHLNLILGTPSNPLPPKGFLIARIERDGVVLPQGVDIKDGEQVAGLRVIVAYGTAAVRGLIKVENGSVPEGARIFVRVTRTGETVPSFRPPTVDERGRFLLEGVPAGTYDLMAMIAGLPGSPRTTKQSITVTDGATMDVTLTIDFNAPAKP